MASDSSSPPSDSPPSPATPPPSSPSPPPPKTSPPPSSQPPPASPPPPASSPPPKHSPSPPPPPKDSPSAPTPKHSPPPPPPPPPPKDSPSAPTPKHSPPSPPATSPPPKASPSPPPPQNSNPSPPPSSSKTPSPPPPPSDGNDTSPPLPSPPAPSPQSSGNDPQSPPPSQQLAPSSPLSPRSSPPSDTPAPNGGSTSGTTVPLIIGVSVAAGLLLFITLLVYSSCTREKKKRGLRWNSMHPPLPPLASPLAVNGGGYMSSNFSGSQGPSSPQPHTSLAVGFSKSTFTYDELAAATEGFSKANLLGEGGFGHVHKGVLPNGKEVAVKSLKAGSGQGQREFRAEVEIISRVHHRHLVSLVGYCIAGARRLLVYEFLPNKTLEYHLHGKGRPTLEWSTRLKIALGSAKGLAYLHEDCHPRIIHRDIKCSNILLDYSFEAKVADFGLAKLNQDNFSHVSTRVMGTFGYLAPEYASSGKLTDKSDVFSYGVMLLELITGRRPVDSGGHLDESLVDWARPLCARALEEGNFDQLADPRLENNYVVHEMTRMVACAAGSIMHSAIRRPKMSQIVRALEGDVSLEDLKLGIKPSQSSELGPSSEYDAGSYGANMTKFNKMVFESNEYASSECEATSEYGLNPSSTSSSGSHEMCRKTSIKQHRLASS